MDQQTQAVAKVTPKDFFLYLGVLASLYWSAGSLLHLLFRIIDRSFPDALQSSYYYGGFDSSMRFAVASLIIIFPVYLILSRMVANTVRREPAKLEIWIRKWFVYLTLFAAGATVVGDLVALVNSFLGGEITIRFALKALSVFVVALAVFWYYMYQLRTRGGTSGAGKVAMSLAVLGVALAIVGGFVVMGTPGEQRDMRFDQERVRDLEQMQWQIAEHYRNKKALPDSLEGIAAGPLGEGRISVDPETGESYTYVKISEVSFELCALFARESSENDPYTRYERSFPAGINGEPSWQHDAGNVCFERTIDPDYFTNR